VERWDVQTLADKAANKIDFKDVNNSSSVNQLIAFPVPGGKTGRNMPRTQPYEFKVYKIKVNLTDAKMEDDSDVHLVAAQPGQPSHTMIIEFPAHGCVGTLQEKQMKQAREALLKAFGPIGKSRFKDLNGSATITGVAFFDVIHGQRGVAPNGIELHPALSFSGSCR
jgi:hypothetical protein